MVPFWYPYGSHSYPRCGIEGGKGKKCMELKVEGKRQLQASSFTQAKEFLGPDWAD